MKWLRLYNETVHDPKWRMIAIETEQPVHAVLAVWMAMLCHASGAEPRGTLTGWNDRLSGAALDLKGSAVEAIRTAMQGVVLDGDRLTAWEKRQFKGDDVKERVKRYRARKAAETDNCNVTSPEIDQGNDGVTLQSPDETLPPLRATDSRSQTLVVVDARESAPDPAPDPKPDLNRGIGAASAAKAIIRAFDTARAAAYGDEHRRPHPHAKDLVFAQRWLAAGADVELCEGVFTATCQGMAERSQAPPAALAFFDQPIADAIATRNRPMPEGKPNDQRRGVQSVRPQAPASRFQRILDRDLAGCAGDA
ncbi:hypothetical protein TSA6c_32715 [Azospirillum sp. TSA6c]|uniref:hypothetical protein n=1 Tax=Azospirillum sp. TSA6c TaxID=709813 RepID=UPI000D6125BF|nr:hypothetical protein [Azospirillum sp. TSA6c]PWC50637.1 hypothetical protein TSA6c_32715 [Azospirillum sp. TSA6c]